MKPPKYTSLPDRFWSKVDVDSKTCCWEWTGFINRGGYGRLTHKRKSWSAHRFSAIDSKGEIPDGLFVLHHCDNRRCVRPSHLYYGTQKQNIHDMIRRGRWNGGSRKGEASWRSKLTDKTVLEARSLHSTGRYTKAALARRYGVAETTLSNALSGQTWSHV